MRSFIGIDFSINKPGICWYFKGEFNFLFCPLNMKKKDEEMYKGIPNLFYVNRNTESFELGKWSSNALVREHTIRSIEEANLIISELEHLLFSDPDFDADDCWLATEGLAFASQGDSTLNLATYKGVFLSKLYEKIKIKNMFTYPPISIKSIAGCSKKEMLKDKGCMINAFLNEKHLIGNGYRDALEAGHFIKKTSYCVGTDDLIDSFWVLKTMYIKEKLLGIPAFD